MYASAPLQKNAGNALFLILIAVALFAALSYVVAHSERSGSGSVTREKAKLQAAQILGYFTSLRQATNRLLISDCTEYDLSFEDSQFSYDYAYAFPGPVAQDKCKVFHPNGGGVPYIRPSPDINGGNHIQILENIGIDGIGAVDGFYSELVAFVPDVQDELCRQLNIALGIGDVIPVDTTPRTFLNYFTKASVLRSGPGFVDGVWSGHYAQCLRFNSITFTGQISLTNKNVFYFSIIEK